MGSGSGSGVGPPSQGEERGAARLAECALAQRAFGHAQVGQAERARRRLDEGLARRRHRHSGWPRALAAALAAGLAAGLAAAFGCGDLLARGRVPAQLEQRVERAEQPRERASVHAHLAGIGVRVGVRVGGRVGVTVAVRVGVNNQG